MRQMPSAEERHPEYFDLANDVITQLIEWLHSGEIAQPDTALQIAELAFITRSFNLYRAIVLLLRTDHWEEAFILTRSLFELLLNLEEIQRDERSAESRAQRFLLFDRLQQYRQRCARHEYEVRTGRIKAERERMAELDAMARDLFAMFLSKGKEGKKSKRWHTSWCGKNVKELAKASQVQTRLSQYEVLYAEMSALAHSTPAAVMSTVKIAENQHRLENIREDANESERERLLEVLSLATEFTLEVVLRAREVLTTYDPAWNLAILKRIFNFYGVEGPQQGNRANTGTDERVSESREGG